MASNPQEKFQLLAVEPIAYQAVTTILGNLGEVYGNADVGKAMKMSTDDNYVACASGDEIEGFLATIMTSPMGSEFGDDGQIIKRMGGTVEKRTLARMEVQVAAAQAEAIPVLGYVVAGDQLALGAKGKAQVIAGNPTKQLWRIISVITGDNPAAASAGDTVLIERA